jgi:hypothetical protein
VPYYRTLARVMKTNESSSDSKPSESGSHILKDLGRWTDGLGFEQAGHYATYMSWEPTGWAEHPGAFVHRGWKMLPLEVPWHHMTMRLHPSCIGTWPWEAYDITRLALMSPF